MVKARIKVRKGYLGSWYDFGIYEGKRHLMGIGTKLWAKESSAIRNAQKMAKIIGVPYDKELIVIH